MQDDRSRLAGELDAAVARAQRSWGTPRAKSSQRLETAGGVSARPARRPLERGLMWQTVAVTIAGRVYRMACGEGEEAHLQSLARHVDATLTDLRQGFGEISATSASSS